MLKDNLVQLGLTNNEAETYIYLTENYKAKASEIARHLDVTHPAAKKILDSLVHKALIRIGTYGKSTFYFPEDSDNLVEYVKNLAEKSVKENNKKIDLAKSIDQILETKTNISTDSEIGLEFYKGKEGSNIIAQQIAAAQNKTVYEFYDRDLLVYNKSKDKIDHKKLFEKNNINFEVIYTAKEEGSKSTIETNEVKLSKDQVALPTAEIDVYDDKVCFSFIDDDVKSFIIKNQHIANSIRTLISNLKEELKKNK
ncbi:MAG: helix-turn-helix domain-containing protein [Patescibacteria group bacterium]